MTSETGARAPDTPPQLFAPRRRLILKGRNGLAASVVSSMALVALILGVLFGTGGGQSFRFYFFNPHFLWIALRGDPAKAVSSVLGGIVTNVWIFLLCEVLVLCLALIIAWIRISTTALLYPFRLLATIYTDIFRGIPFVLVIYIVGYGLPQLSLGPLSTQSPAVYGCIALTLTYTAYVSEVYRAGLHSVPHGQILAARSLGLTQYSTMRFVVLPQAVRTVIPPLLNDFISLQKDTALVSLIGVVETSRAAQIGQETYFNGSFLTMSALLFLALTIPMTRFTDHLIDKDREKRLAGAQ
ncbi:MAG: amino acid ABC transporter permease [Actinomycetota bacterium]|nr:amino acid ABC transporter permease [Actinomycetota bacterium]